MLLLFLYSITDRLLVLKSIHMLCFRPAGSKKEERSGQRDEGTNRGFTSRVSTMMFKTILYFAVIKACRVSFFKKKKKKRKLCFGVI